MHPEFSIYLEKELSEVLSGLSAVGFIIRKDELGSGAFRNVVLSKGDDEIELVCVPMEIDEYQDGLISAEDAQWWVEDLFDNGVSLWDGLE